jgi:hypothetical protein
MGLSVLLSSLSRWHPPTTARPVIVMVTAAVSVATRSRIRKLGAEVLDVAPLAGPAAPHVAGWAGTGYTKLHLWGLTRFRKVVYIDADAMVTGPVVELFDRPGAPLPAAAPDVFPPDRFNAGVLVVEPDAAVFAALLAAAGLPSTPPAAPAATGGHAAAPTVGAGVLCVCDTSTGGAISAVSAPVIVGRAAGAAAAVTASGAVGQPAPAVAGAAPTLHSYDGGDTGFLNAFFPEWWSAPAAHRLPFAFNAQRTLHWLTHARQPGYWQAVQPVRILHFSSSPKPWEPAAAAKKGELELLWWEEYLRAQMVL